MKVTSLKHISILSSIVALMTALASSILAGVGFQADLDTPPSFVSSYKEQSVGLSVALSPKSYPSLAFRRQPGPKATYSNHDTQSIRFDTEYYKIGRESKKLIPISVDAQQYLEYRQELNERSRFTDLVARGILNPGKSKERRGLRLGVALPKRLGKIFGEGGAGLKLKGNRNITFSGRSSWTDTPNTPGRVQSKFPSLNMEQISRLEITGTIGSKISVKVNQDSQTEIPLENRIQIRYKGDEDDILKVVEAGNTTLQIPNTQFAGYSSRIRGLFGIKAIAQIGSLSLTAIASQEKASSEQHVVSASGQEENALIKRDDEYIERRVFDLLRPGELSPDWRIVELYVYETTRRNINNDQAFESVQATAYVNPEDTAEFPNDTKRGLDVVEIDQESFQLRHDRTGNYVVFRGQRQSNKVLAVYMVAELRDADSVLIETREIGNVSEVDSDNKSVYRLKLLYSDQSRPHQSGVWELMWRNCYSLPRNVSAEDLEVRILKGLAGNEKDDELTHDEQFTDDETSEGFYLAILGLDQYKGKIRQPDNRLDDLPEIVDTALGLLIFPNRRPFDSDETYGVGTFKTKPLRLRVPGIYDYTSLQEKGKASQYFLKIISKSRSSIILLRKTNIIENSERVTLNGRVLEKGVDYNIQYDFGRVTLLSDEALDPNSELNVEFEYAPFFSVAKKTLMGVRAEYELSRDFKVGTTFLYKSDKAQERKPRVGQETSKTYILDADVSLTLHPNFLTKIVDALPLISADGPSNLTLSGEIAQSRPNPNVDGVAYVDDFESSQDRVSLGMVRRQWKIAVAPEVVVNDTNIVWVSGKKTLWHSLRDRIDILDVWDRQSAAGEGTFHPFRIIFRPNNQRPDTTFDKIVDSISISIKIDTTFLQCTDTLGETCIAWGETTSQDLADSLEFDTSDVVDTAWIVEIIAIDTVEAPSWGGVTKYLGRNRIDKSRLQLFEIRTNKTSGLVHFDFGQISEDINFNGENDSEVEQGVFTVSESEDIGLDHVSDGFEEGSGFSSDPNGDNWYFDGEPDGECPLPPEMAGQCDTDEFYYEWLNGTENNRRDSNGKPDEEQMSESLNTNNSYFSFAIDFGDTTFLVKGSEWPDPLENPGAEVWRTFRIPITDPAFLDSSNTVGEPDWSLATHARVWFEAGVADQEEQSLEVASWQFVQSNWTDSIAYKTDIINKQLVFAVASVSEDDGTFSPPAGVDAYEDPTTGVTESQRGLLLAFRNLTHLEDVIAVKELPTVERYSGYQGLKMFVYSQLEGGGATNVEFFFRMGRNESNYYEYFTKLRPGWDRGNFVDIKFDEITNFKDSVIRNFGPFDKNIDTVVTSGHYRVLGKPNLNEIRYFQAGVRNLDETQGVSGDIWLDELRVTDVRRDVGTAGRFSASGNMADLLTYGFNFKAQDAFFRKLSAPTRGGSRNNLGSGNSRTDYSYNVRLNAEKFLPRSWGARIPLSYSANKSVTTPLLRNNSDVVLLDRIRELEKSSSESKNITAAVKFKSRSKNKLFTLFLNRADATFSYSRSTRETFNRPFNFGENYNLRSNFNMGMRTPPSIPIFFWTKFIPIVKKTAGSRLRLYPTTWKLSSTFSRNLSVTEDTNERRTSSLKRDFQGIMKISWGIFDNLTTTYSYDTRRDLSDPKLINLSLSNPKLGLETNYRQNFTANYDPKLFGFFTSAFNYKADYSDSYNRASLTRSGSHSQSWGVDGSFSHIAFLGGDKKIGGRPKSRSERQQERAAKRRGEVVKKEEKKKRFYDYPLSYLRKLTGWIKPLSYHYGETYNARTPGLTDRPSAEYRFGLTRELGVERKAGDIGNVSAGTGRAFDFGSGFTLFGGLGTDVRFRRNITEDVIKSGGRYRNTSTTWPDVGIRISQFKSFPLIKGMLNSFIRVFSPRTGFNRQTKETFNLDKGFITRSSTTQAFRPLLSVNFKLLRSLSLSSSFNLDKKGDKSFNSTSGLLQSESKSNKKSLVLTSKYSFTAPGGISIPIIGKLRFKSTVSIEVSVKMNGETKEVSKGGGPFKLEQDRSDMSISTRLSYVFSRQIKGGVSGTWRDQNSARLDKKTHLRELRIWVDINF